MSCICTMSCQKYSNIFEHQKKKQRALQKNNNYYNTGRLTKNTKNRALYTTINNIHTGY